MKEKGNLDKLKNILKNSKKKKVETGQVEDSFFSTPSFTQESVNTDEIIDKGISIENRDFKYLKHQKEKEKKALELKIKEYTKYKPENSIEKIAKEDLSEEDYKSLKDLKEERQIFLKEKEPVSEILSDAGQQVADIDRTWYNPETIGDMFFAGVYNIGSLFTPVDAGLTEKDGTKLNDLNFKIKKLERSSLEKKRNELQNVYDSLSEQTPASSIFTSEENVGAKKTALGIYKQLIDDIDIKLNDNFSSVFDNIGRKLNPHNLTFGLSELAENTIHVLPLANKIKNGEELDANDQELAKALSIKQELEGSSELTNDNYWTKAAVGSVESFNFLGQILTARSLAGGISKKTGKKLIRNKVNKNLAKFAGGLTEAAALTTIMPSTYNNMLEKYNGLIEVSKSEKGLQFLMGQNLYDKYEKDLEVNKIYDTNRLKELSTKENLSTKEKIEIEDLNFRLGLTTDNPNNTFSYEKILKNVKPKSLTESVLKGYGNNYAELISEIMGGKILGKVLPKMSLKTPTNNFLTRSANATKSFRDKIALGSLKEEYLEELFVAPLNSLVEWDDTEAKMLLSPEYHLEILAQTAFMGGAFRLPGVPHEIWNSLNNKKDYTEQKKYQTQLRNFVNTVGRSTEYPELANYIDIKANKNSLRIDDFLIEVKNLENEGNFKEATKLKNKFSRNLLNLGVKTGNEKLVKKELEKIDENITLDTKNNIDTFIKTLLDVKEEFKNSPNVNNLIDIKTFEFEAKEELKILEDTRRPLLKEVEEDIKNVIKNKKEFKNIDFDIENLFTSDKEFLSYIQKKNIPNVEKLFNIDAISNLILENLNYNKKLFAKHSSDSFQEDLKKHQDFIKIYKEKLNSLENKDLESVLNVIDEIKTPVKENFKKNFKASVENSFYKEEELKKENKKEIINQYKEPSLNTEPDFFESNLDSKESNIVLNLTGKKNNKTSDLIIDSDQLDELYDAQKDFSLPIENIPETKKDFVKTQIANLSETYKKRHGNSPSFPQLVSHLSDKFGKEITEDLFNSLVLGWKLNGYKEYDYNKIYNDIFEDLDKIEKEALDNLYSTLKINEELKEIDLVERTNNIVDSVKEEQKEIIGNDSLGANIKSISGKKIVNPNLKFAFSTLDYLENIDEEGNFSREDLGTLKESSLIDPKDLVNPNLYNVGDKLKVSIADEKLWDKIVVIDDNFKYGRNKEGVLQKISFSNWLEKNTLKNPDFKNTQRYLEKVPIFILDKQGKPLAYIHDTDWFNPYNVGDPFNENVEIDNLSPQHLGLIQEGKNNTLKVRQDIINNNLSEIEITEKKEGAFSRLSKDKPSISISESNPDSIVAIQSGSEIITGYKTNFENSERTIINNPLDFTKVKNGRYETNGNNWILNHIDTVENTEGKKIKRYRAFPVLRKNENGENGISVRDLDTVRYAYSAYVENVKEKQTQEGNIAEDRYNKNIKSSKYELTKEESNNIIKEILTLTGINISDYKGISDFSKLYTIPRKVNSKVGDIFFSENLTDYAQHTNIYYLNKDIQIPSIDENKTVKSLSNSYQEFLRDTLHTNIKSFNVGEEDKPVYATSLQPVINFKLVKDNVEEIIETLPVKESIENLDVDTTIKNFLEKEGFDFHLESELQNTDENLLKDYLKTATNLSIKQEEDLIGFIKNSFYRKLNTKETYTISEIFENSRKEFLSFIKPKVDFINENLLKVTNEDLKSKLTKAKESFNTINNNWKTLAEKSLQEVEVDQNLNISSETDTIEEKDYNKTAFENIGKLKISKKLKRLLSNIKERDKEGEVVKGFLNIPLYMNIDEVYNSITQMLVEDIPIESNFESLIKRLSFYKEKNIWLEDIIEAFKNSDEQLKNQLVYNFKRHALKMKFAMVSSGSNPILKVFDTNANEIKRTIVTEWNNNLTLTKLVDTDYKINKDFAKTLLEKFNTTLEKSEITQKDINTLLSNFGINLDNKVLDSIVNSKLFDKGQILKKEDFLFTNKGLVYNLREYLEKSINKNFNIQNETEHPFYNASGSLNTLAKEESLHRNQALSISFRDNQKTVSGVINNSFMTDRVSEIKSDTINGENGIINKLENDPFSKNSLLLNILKEDPNFVNHLNIDHLGLTSIKELGKKSSSFSNITDLNSLDYDLVQLTGIQDLKQGSTTFKDSGISFRIGRTFFPTMSDKSSMAYLTTGIYNFYKEKDFVFEKDFKFKEPLREIIYKRLVLPELERIVIFNTQIKETNIKNYDYAAKRFNIIPTLNTVKIDDISILDYLNLKDIEDLNLKDVESKYKELLIDELELNLKNQFEQQKQKWSSIDKEVFDKSYLDQNKDLNKGEQKDLAIYDFILNTNIQYMDMYKIFSGDIAFYSKDGDLKKSNATAKKEFIRESKKLGTNLGKRLALLLAPGINIANSKNEKYYQIFLKDDNSMAENVAYLVKAHYGENIKDNVDQFSTLAKKDQQTLIKKWQNKYPKIKEFFNIESTDAQEYTTVKEHVNILFRQGRLEEDKYKNIIEKLNKNEVLKKEELNIVLQPLKPVYTGQIFNNGILRPVYIKSSSYPLLPQVTSGTALDELRQKMEEIEQKTGKYVRASYETANKIGGTKEQIDPVNPIGIEEDKNMLLLNRENFRIQQDVPFKSDIKKEDKISMGTQIFKMLFSNGITKEKNFLFNGEEKTGQELYDIFNKTFSKYINNKKQLLYNRLGLDSSGNIVNQKETYKKIEKVLKEEAIKRGMSNSEIENLNLIPIRFNDNVIYQFKVPLWLNVNGDSFESLMNSIVSNNLMKIKIPGNSFVAGSEHGYNTIENLSSENKSRIIWRDNWNGKELQAAKVEKGNFKTSQVLLPSKFKDSQGKLIDLFKKVNGKYFYITKTEKGFILKKEKFDSELFENFTFRTPTSSHVSAAVVEIVGILPPEVGDLIVVPKGFGPQKGLDYDVDKENNYQYNHILLEDGSIKKLKEEHKSLFTTKLKNLNKDEDVDQLFSVIFGEEYEDILEDEKLSEEDKKETLNLMFDNKLLENDFIETHNSVFKNPSNNIQTKINAVLSMEFAEKQADKLEEVNKEDTFSLLSPEYQKYKMSLGAVGKMAIGVYSNYVTFHGLTTVANKPVSIKEPITIGKYSSNKFGNLKTLDGGRSITDVLAEKQNTATDNEKAQILGRVGINKNTIGVDAILSLLGFDKDVVNGEEISIPYYFLSQPIIKEFNKKLEASQGIVSEFNKDLEQSLTQELFKRETKLSGVELQEYIESPLEGGSLTGVSLMNSLENSNSSIQAEVLKTFLHLKKLAKELSSIQQVINTNNLGKSILEVDKTFETLSQIQNSNFSNIENLIGDFKKEEEIEDKKGYLYIDNDLYVRPSSPQGEIAINGILIGKKTWGEFFPYFNEDFKRLFGEYNNYVDNENPKKSLESKKKILNGFKKYINSKASNGIFSRKAYEEREELFINSEKNEALGNYLQKILKENTLLRNNKLLSKLSFENKKSKEPSIIKFNNSANDSFNEDYLSKSLIELIIEDKVLPDRNNKEYSTKKLAEDLIKYAYLEGGVQEAVQFVKYIPIQYLEAISTNNNSIAQNYRKMGSEKTTSFRSLIGFTEDKELSSIFFKQYIQHNPEIASIKLQEKFYYNADKTELNVSEEHPNFISIKNPTKSKIKQDKWSLFEKIDDFKYQKIDVLGTFGMSEYQFNNTQAKSLVNPGGTVEFKKVAIKKIKAIKNNSLGIETGKSVLDVLKNIEYTNFGNKFFLSKTAKILKEFVNEKTQLEVSAINEKSFDRNNDIITIGQKYLSLPEDKLAKIFLHEYIHSITSNEIEKYLTKNGDYYSVVQKAPSSVSKLILQYNRYRKTINKNKLKEFNLKLENYKKGEKITFTEEETEKIYPATNIQEFIAASLTSEKFIKHLETFSGYVEKIKTAISDFISSLIKDVTQKSLAKDVIKTTLDFLEEESSNKKVMNSTVDFNKVQKDYQIESGKNLKIVIEKSNFEKLIETLDKKDC